MPRRREAVEASIPDFPGSGSEYRIRVMMSPKAAKLFGSDEPYTAHPGIIKRNRPKADRFLTAYLKTHDAWLEVRAVNTDEAWKRIA